MISATGLSFTIDGLSRGHGSKRGAGFVAFAGLNMINLGCAGGSSPQPEILTPIRNTINLGCAGASLNPQIYILDPDFTP